MRWRNKMERKEIDFKEYTPEKLVQKMQNEEDLDIEIGGFETVDQLRKYNRDVIQGLMDLHSEKNYFHRVNEKSLAYFIDGQD